jgi:hypothetical protein
MIDTSMGKQFHAMADRIDHSMEMAHFGGACVIIPPDGGGDSIELLLLDASADPAQFWATIATRIQLILQRLEQQRGAYGR